MPAERGRLDPEIALLLGFLDEAFDKKAWHGTTLRGSIRGVDVRRAAVRPRPGRHNIWEIVVHAAYWKYAVRRRLTGVKRGSFAPRGSNWFLREGGSESDWRADVARLGEEHSALRSAVAGLTARDLPRVARGAHQTNLALVRGIAAHDLYHAGQIQLLKRLAG